MSKAFDRMMQGLDEVGAFLGVQVDGFQVHVPESVDVKKIRQQ